MKSLRLIFFGIIFLSLTHIQAQQNNYADVEPSPFDFGKMWTFEHPPLDYFEKTYGFRPTEEWLEKARMSSLRFKTFCSASFISPDGLILTNYHCSHGESAGAVKEGEDLEKNGFYAATRAEERRVEGLFVKQLVKMEDITPFVKNYTDKATNDKEFKKAQSEAFEAAVLSYSEKADWKGLEVEPVTYYNGGKYSIYGYKKFDDVRLVLLPELEVGLYGGDPDNFTYPRYNLDFTLWRVYENGEPVNSSDFHFDIKPEGPSEGEDIYLIGNPARTERYRTMAQLEYDRDYRYNIFLERIKNRMAILEEIYAETPSHGLKDQILTFSNSVKAIGGILEGLHDPYLMGKKMAMERQVRLKSNETKKTEDYWERLAAEMESMEDFAAENTLLAPSPLGGAALLTAHAVAAYRKALKDEKSEEDLKVLREQVMRYAKDLNTPMEQKYLAMLLKELKDFADENDTYVDKLLNGMTPESAAKYMLEKTKFANSNSLEKLLKSKPKRLEKSNDPILEMANLLVPEYQKAAAKNQMSKPRRDALMEKIGGEIFKVYGLSVPPDASFTLRIADGVVKRYDYNGTTAPYKTTYFGLYNRAYSNDLTFPWSLPEKWKNPSMDLLKSPLNFISTNDSIGGNSGSPVINKEGKLVGLLFDGNIQSLPGNFIYDSTSNRAVSVHVGGILAAMKYVYSADSLLKELGQ